MLLPWPGHLTQGVEGATTAPLPATGAEVDSQRTADKLTTGRSPPGTGNGHHVLPQPNRHQSTVSPDCCLEDGDIASGNSCSLHVGCSTCCCSGVAAYYASA